MRIFITTLLWCLVYGSVIAQDTTFQTAINVVVNGNDQAWDIINTDNGYLILSGTHCNDTGYGCIGLAEVNEVGEMIWSKVYNEYPNPSITTTIIQGNNNNYFVGGTKANINGGQSYLMSLNNEGDSLWTKVYELSSISNMIRDVKVHINGSIMACGTIDTISYLYRIDTLGTLLSKSFWYEGELNTSKGLDFLGLQTLVANRSRKTGSSIFYGNILAYNELDSLIWHKRVFKTTYASCTPTLTTLSNHTALVGFCQDTLLSSDSYPSAQGLMAIDSMGNEKWHHFFDAPYEKRIQNLYTLSDGNFLGVGNTYENNDYQGWLFKMSASGELLWEHRYLALNYLQNIGAWLWTATESPDGGIVAAGSITGVTDIGIGWESDVWFIKTDANGCVGNPNNCLEEDIFLHIEEENGVSQWVSGYPIHISPNPTQGQLTLQYQTPPHLQSVHFQVYTLTGQLVYQTPLGTGLSLLQERQVVLPDNVTSGMYFYQVQSEAGRLGSGKLAVR